MESLIGNALDQLDPTQLVALVDAVVLLAVAGGCDVIDDRDDLAANVVVHVASGSGDAPLASGTARLSRGLSHVTLQTRE
jgi:hypothetical protein